MTLEEIIAECRARATQTVPFAGEALGELKRGASYLAAKEKTLGVDTFWVGGKLRTASIDILRRLGAEDAVAPTRNEHPVQVTPPSAAATPAVQLTSPKSVPARSRKPPAPKAMAARKAPASEAPRLDRRRNRQPETVT